MGYEVQRCFVLAHTLTFRMQKQYYSQFTFKPAINRISSVIGRPTPLNELVANEQSKRVKQEVLEEVEKDLEEQCTFRPKVA